MKKLLKIFISLVLLLVACSNKKPKLMTYGNEFTINVSEYYLYEYAIGKRTHITYAGMPTDNSFSIIPDGYRLTTNVYFPVDIDTFLVYQQSGFITFKKIKVDKKSITLKIININ